MTNFEILEQQQAEGPSADHIIRALKAELDRINDNRVFLLATIAQLNEEFEQARGNWANERESLLKRISDSLDS